MLDVFTAVLLAIAVLLVAAMTWVVAVRRARPPAHTAVSTSATVIDVTFVAMAVAVGTFLVSIGLGLGVVASAVAALAVGLSVLAWWPRGRVWTVRGVATWALVVDAAVMGLACAVGWLVTADLPAPLVVAGITLCVVETVVVVIGLRHVRIFLDGHARRVRPEPHPSARPRLGVPPLAASATAAAFALLSLPVVASSDSGDAASPAGPEVPKAAGVVSHLPVTPRPSESPKPARTKPSDSASPAEMGRARRLPTTEASRRQAPPGRPAHPQSNHKPPTKPTTDPTEQPTTDPTDESNQDQTGPPHGHPTHPPHGGGNDN